MSAATPSARVVRRSAFMQHNIVDITTIEGTVLSSWNTATGNNTAFLTREAGGIRCGETGVVRVTINLDYASNTARKSLKIFVTVNGVAHIEERNMGYARVNATADEASPFVTTEVAVPVNALLSLIPVVVSGPGGTPENITYASIRAEYK